MAEASSAPNTLGLDFDRVRIQSPSDSPQSQKEHIPDTKSTADSQQSPLQRDAQDLPTPEADNLDPKERKKPYINPERVKTGGTQRDKLSEEALTERMARMKEQNEKIKQRRVDVKADEDAFRKTQESERVRLAQSRKVQEHVDRTREQNARRKMDKIQSREWDSGKSTGDWKQHAQKTRAGKSIGEDKEMGVAVSGLPPPVSGSSMRGARGGPPRGKGRGRGSGGTERLSAKSTELDAAPMKPSANKTSLEALR